MHLESNDIASGLSDERFSFVTSSLANRDITQRFSDKEKSELALYIQQSWENLHQDAQYRQAEILSLTSENFTWGKYPDAEAYARVDQHRQAVINSKHDTHLYASVNLEDSDDVLATQTILLQLQRPNTILGTAYFPYERGDRPEIHVDGSQELLLLNTLIMNIQHSGVRGLIHISPHSPAFPWFCLKAGISPLSLSIIPGLIKEAAKQGFLDDIIITANSDDGAKSSRLFLTNYIQCEDSINGTKRKENGKTIVTYTEEDFRKVKNKTVIFTEDIISTGGTMASSIFQLLNQGQAKRIIILATYPIFAGNAFERLGLDSRIQIITTDGRTPMTDITKSNYVTIIPVKDKLPKVLELDKQGVNFWSQTGKEKLEELGLCIFPW